MGVQSVSVPGLLPTGRRFCSFFSVAVADLDRVLLGRETMDSVHMFTSLHSVVVAKLRFLCRVFSPKEPTRTCLRPRRRTQKGRKNCAGKASGRGNGQIMTKAKDRFQTWSYVLTSLTFSTFIFWKGEDCTSKPRIRQQTPDRSIARPRYPRRS